MKTEKTGYSCVGFYLNLNLAWPKGMNYKQIEMIWKPKSNILEWKKWSKHPPSKHVIFGYFNGRQIDRSEVLFSVAPISIKLRRKNFKNWWLLEGRKSVQEKDIPSKSYDVPFWLDVKSDRNHSIDSRIPTTCSKRVQRKFSLNFSSFFLTCSTIYWLKIFNSDEFSFLH